MKKIIKIFLILCCFGQIVSGQNQSTKNVNQRANSLVENDSLLIIPTATHS